MPSAKAKAKKEEKEKKETKEKSDGGGKDKPKSNAAAAAQPIGKAKRKANFVSWFSECLKTDTNGARGQFLKARDYVAVANVFRKAVKDTNVAGTHAEALKLLDSKGHFMNIVDQCAGTNEETSKSWTTVKTRQRLKFEKAGGSTGIAEKKRAQREAKEQFKQMKLAREEREQRAKNLKQLRREYKATMNVCRMKGACLDWCNLGKCSFGEACEFKHEEEDKASLVELAKKIKANGVGGRTGEKDAERVAKIKAKKELKKEQGGDDGEDGDGKKSAKKTSFETALGDLSDDDSDSDSESNKPKKKKLSVLPGENSDDNSDDELVPKIIREKLKRKREEERDILERREKRREDKARERERAKKEGSAGGRGGGGRGSIGGGRGGAGRGGGRSFGDPSAGRFEQRPPRSFDGSGEKKKKKPRHADGRHALNAAATAAGKGRPRTKFD